MCHWCYIGKLSHCQLFGELTQKQALAIMKKHKTCFLGPFRIPTQTLLLLARETSALQSASLAK